MMILSALKISQFWMGNSSLNVKYSCRLADHTSFLHTSSQPDWMVFISIQRAGSCLVADCSSANLSLKTETCDTISVVSTSLSTSVWKISSFSIFILPVLFFSTAQLSVCSLLVDYLIVIFLRSQQHVLKSFWCIQQTLFMNWNGWFVIWFHLNMSAKQV